jgi:hypothetical protein
MARAAAIDSRAVSAAGADHDQGDGLAALGRGEQRGQDSERDRQDDGRADAHHGAGGDHHCGGVSPRGQHGGGGEHGVATGRLR